MPKQRKFLAPTTLVDSTVEWISATMTRSYAMFDPCLDWLSHMAKLRGEDIVPGAFVQYLMKSGVEFENKVVVELKQRFGAEFHQVVDGSNRGRSSNEDKLVLYRETIRLMKEGVPIIYQPFLLDEETRVYGTPDFLVRSDHLRRLTSVRSLADEMEETMGCKIARKYHYVVVDCKWTTLNFCVDHLHLRNSGSITAFKCQLAIYHHCLERIQGSVQKKAFILGKRWKAPSGPVTDDCFNKLGIIDYNGKDEKFMSMAFKAVKWLQDLKREGHKWVLYPQPTREELYPNMKNHNDDPWHNQKVEIAKRLNDITMVWYCKHTNRKTCFAKGIRSWTDPRCTVENMGIKGKIIGPVIQQILNVNRSTTHWILPEKLASDKVLHNGWLEKRKGDFFVDFEFISMIDNGLESFPAANVDGLVYLIGTGYYDESGKWQYKSFLSKRITHEEEKRIFQEWIAFIMRETHKQGLEIPRLLHWGCAEATWFEKHTNKFPIAARAAMKISLLNVLDEIKRYPITIKGAFGFGLKEIGSALHKLGKISTAWLEIGGALDTITHIMSLQDQAVRAGTDIIHCEGASKLLDYNETDCKVVAEIITVLRHYYLEEDEEEEMVIKIGKRKRNVVIDSDPEDPIEDPDDPIEESVEETDEESASEDDEDNIPLSVLKRRIQRRLHAKRLKNDTVVDTDDTGMENLITGKWRKPSDKLDDSDETESMTSEGADAASVAESVGSLEEFIDNDGDLGGNEEYLYKLPDEQEDPIMSEVQSQGRKLDQLRIKNMLECLTGGDNKFTKFQQEHIMEHLRILNELQENTQEYFQLLNYLLYYTQTHDIYNIKKYVDEPTPMQIEELDAIKEIEINRGVDFKDVFDAPLQTLEKATLFEKLFILNNTTAFTTDWFTLRDEIRRTINDAKALTEEQRVILNAAPARRDNYLARIADSQHSTVTKSYLIARYKKAIGLQEGDSDKHKEYQILDYALALPTAEEPLPAIDIDTSLVKAHRYLNQNVYGMKNIKEEFLLYMLEAVVDQHKRSNVIGLCGSPGIGKSTFANGIGVAFDQPMYRINMGGISDGSMLMGSAPVWIGADIGLFARALITCGRKKCIIVLEEIDKISKSTHGEEILQLLTHVLDPTFNDQITDKFLGMSFSLRDVTFVVTLNDKNNLPPVIRNRIRLFELPDPKIEEKIQTCQRIIIPRLRSTYGFADSEVIFSNEIIERLNNRIGEDKGLRSLESLLTTIFRKLMALKKLRSETSRYLFSFTTKVESPYIVDEDLAECLIKDEKIEGNEAWRFFYR